jgi:hypothetical protein
MRALRAEKAALQARVAALTAEAQALQGRLEIRAAVPVASPAPLPPLAPSASAATNDMAALVAARDGEIAALRAALAEARSRPAAPAPAAAPPAQDRRTAFRERMRNAMERLKRESPEQYERLQQERQQRRQQAADMAAARAAFLREVPTEGLSEEYYRNHTALVARIEFIDASMARLAAAPDAEESHRLRHAVFRSIRGLDDMLLKEREILYADLADQAGYRDAAAQQFVDYLNYVNEMTDRPDFRMFGRGRRRDRGPGGSPTPAPATP